MPVSGFRCYQDNVVVRLEPLDDKTKGGIHIVDLKNDVNRCRRAKVLSSGPGHYRQKRGGANGTVDGAFIPNETRPGDMVLVNWLAGSVWDMDISIPRHNKSPEFTELLGDSGELRVLREAEILAILDEA